jgi:predicted SAM-dependent methyltransferase
MWKWWRAHVVEHLEDPIGALKHMLRVTRPGGIVLLTLPDGRHRFDARRARTTVEHLLRDHEEGPHASRLDRAGDAVHERR